MRTPDFFITIAEDDRPLLRLDVYGDFSSESHPFQDALVCRERVFVGYGHRVYVIEPRERRFTEVFLGEGFSYFASFYKGQDYLLVASAESLLRLTPDGTILWRTRDLGLDGVVVTSVKDGKIEGKGEWDPPGGWKPFALRLDSGKLIGR